MTRGPTVKKDIAHMNTRQNPRRLLDDASPLRGLIVMLLLVICAAGAARGASISFFGAFQFADADQDGFRERLTLSGPAGEAGFIFLGTPAGDPLAGGNVRVEPILLDPTDYVAGEYFRVAPPLIREGLAFTVAGSPWMTADMAIRSIDIHGAAASINADFDVNLTNIQTTAAYPGTSPLIERMLLGPGGAAVMTLNHAGDFSSAITDGPVGSISAPSTYSGTIAAADATVIPTPAAFTAGLAGLGLLALLRRRRRAA